MLTKEKIFKLLQEKHPYLAAEFGVGKIGLFGSYANGQSGDDSDIDLIVEFERPIGFRFMDLVDYLENLLGHKVDVLTPAGVQNIRIEWVARSISQSIVYVYTDRPRVSHRHPRGSSANLGVCGRDDV